MAAGIGAAAVGTSSDPELCLAPKQTGAPKACPAENLDLSSTGNPATRPKSEAIGDSEVRLHVVQAFLVSHSDATCVALRPGWPVYNSADVILALRIRQNQAATS
ncbi:hypothetical protein VE00_10658 [Pseudogymnoascus sp. WSF 3629]|nr:hypothetical protein VE00_10658 [Pseudogymnoascus sp. WSF 3629]